VRVTGKHLDLSWAANRFSVGQGRSLSAMICSVARARERNVR
jgi:hypothetical protein